MKPTLYASPCKTMELLGDSNFCVPLAFSIVSGVDVVTVNNFMRTTPSVASRGRMMREFRRGVYEHDWASSEFLSFLNITLERVFVRASTVSSIERELDPQYRYLVKVKRHLLAIREGMVQDWTQGRRHKIIRVYRICRDGAPITDRVNAPAPRVVPVAPAFVPRAVVPAAPVAPSDLLVEIAAMFVGKHFRINQSGRWVSVKTFSNDTALKVTRSNGRLVLCLTNKDNRFPFVARELKVLSARKNDTTFVMPSRDFLNNLI